MTIRNFKMLSGLLVLSAGRSLVSAATPPQTTALLARSFAALISGKPLQDAKLEGTANYVAGSDEETGPAVLEAAGDLQDKVVLSLSGGQRQQIQNGEQAMSIEPNGQSQRLPLHNSLSPAAWFFPPLLVQGLIQRSSYSVTYAGLEDLNGTSVHHFSAVRTPQGQGDPGTMTLLLNLSQFDLYVDAGNFLPVSLAFNTHPDHNALQDIPVSIEFSGYQKMSGIMTPLHIQKFLQRSLLLDISITSVTINPGAPPSEFQIQ